MDRYGTFVVSLEFRHNPAEIERCRENIKGVEGAGNRLALVQPRLGSREVALAKGKRPGALEEELAQRGRFRRPCQGAFQMGASLRKVATDKPIPEEAGCESELLVWIITALEGGESRAQVGMLVVHSG